MARPGQEAFETEEGVSAVRECINKLKSAAASPALVWVAELAKAAQDHINDIGPKGMTGHFGSNGSDPGARIEKYGDWEVTMGENIDFGNSAPADIVFSWLVDDGVPDREHRNNLLEKAYKSAGIAHGKHREFGVTCCLVFAGGFSSKNGPKSPAQKPAAR